MFSAGRRKILSAVGALGVGAFSLGAVPPDDTTEIDAKAPRAVLPGGRCRLRVTLPTSAIVTIAILGPRDALLGLGISGGRIASRLRRRRPLEEDGLLPRMMTVMTGDESETLDLIVETIDPVEVVMLTARASDAAEPTPQGLKNGSEQPRPLIGFPVPRSDRDGYQIASAARYVFARIDVVLSMISAFEKTRKRFDSDPIAISDASQWNGKRPKTDINVVRHISHEGGCDVDIALPANDTFPSTLRDHCRGVRLTEDRFGCSPGTAKGVDFERLAFLLGTFAEEAPGRILKVFLDDAYRREVIRAAPILHEKKLIKEAGLVALGEDGVLVASPWHTDHVHVRFSGEKGRSMFV